MFRDSRPVRFASLCGWLTAIVFFIVGLVETLRFTRWNPYAKTDWSAMLSSLQPRAGGDFVLHSFIFCVCLAGLFFLLALGSRIYQTHPTTTVTGLGFLGVPLVLMGIYNVWLAFGHDMLVLQYQRTQETGLQYLYQAGLFGLPYMAALVAYFGFWGFVFLGYAFGAQRRALGLRGWCWASAAGLIWSIVVSFYGYHQIYAANFFPRTLMIFGDLGLWILPTITLAISASWLWTQSRLAMVQPVRPEVSKAA